MSHQPHPAAEIFPELSEEDLQELAEDIRKWGLRRPITLLDGLVLDGRNRLKACKIAGVQPRFEVFGGSDPVAFVLSENLHRRHLNAGQRAMAAADAVAVDERLREAAAQRQKANLQNQGLVQEIIPGREGQARDQLGAHFGVSGRYVDTARRLKAEAPKLAQEVRAGKKSLPRAKREMERQKARARMLAQQAPAPAASSPAPPAPAVAQATQPEPDAQPEPEPEISRASACKRDLIDDLAQGYKTSKTEAAEVIDAFIQTMKRVLLKRRSLLISGLFRMDLVEKEPTRKGGDWVEVCYRTSEVLLAEANGRSIRWETAEAS